MPTFELVVHTSDKMLPTILQALEGHATLVRVVQVPSVEEMFPELKPAGPPPPMPSVQLSLPTELKAARKTFRYSNGRHNKGIRGIDLCIKLLKEAGCPLAKKAFFTGFGAHGFAENSASPAISHCLSAGTIIEVSPGVYALAAKTP